MSFFSTALSGMEEMQSKAISSSSLPSSFGGGAAPASSGHMHQPSKQVSPQAPSYAASASGSSSGRCQVQERRQGDLLSLGYAPSLPWAGAASQPQHDQYWRYQGLPAGSVNSQPRDKQVKEEVSRVDERPAGTVLTVPSSTSAPPPALNDPGARTTVPRPEKLPLLPPERIARAKEAPLPEFGSPEADSASEETWPVGPARLQSPQPPAAATPTPSEVIMIGHIGAEREAQLREEAAKAAADAAKQAARASAAAHQAALAELERETRAQLSELQETVEALRIEKERAERLRAEDSQKFYAALNALELEVKELAGANEVLIEEKKVLEEKLQERLLENPTDPELRQRNAVLEQECQDILRQLDEYEKEQEDQTRGVFEEVETLREQLLTQEQAFKKRLKELENEREELLQMMTDEGQELQARVEKLKQDKEALSLDLARALAKADVKASAAAAAEEGALPLMGRVNSNDSAAASKLAEVSVQMRALVNEREVLKDEVTTKDGQLALMKSQLEARDRKLKLADMENGMLKNELEVLRRLVGPGRGPAAQAQVTAEA